MSCEITKCWEDSVRRAPLATLGVTAVGAVVVSRLPIGAIVGASLRLGIALVRPALLVLGIAKAVDLCQQSCASRDCQIGAAADSAHIPEAVS